jgi:hypothetical protein
MIRAITSLLNESVLAMPVGRRVAFAEVIDGVPSEHTSRDQFTPIVADANGGVSYWRADGAVGVETLNATAACGNAVRVSAPLALVAFVRRDQCDDLQGLLGIAANQLRASLRPLRNSIPGAFGTSVSGIKLGVDTVRTKEVAGFVVPASFAVLTLMFVVHVDASDECLDPCGAPYDLLCTLINKASNDKVIECLGPERVGQICGDNPCDLCDVVAPADPSDVVACVTPGNVPSLVAATLLLEGATPEVIVVALDGADKTDEVRALICEPCPPCGSVDILDQNDNVIATVDCPGTYQAFVLDNVNDEEPYATQVIINDA